MHVFDTDSAAVGVPQHTQNLAQQHGAPAAEPAGDEFAIEVPKGEAVALDFQVGVRSLPIFQRVNVGHQVTAHPIRVDQFLNPRGLINRVGGVHCDVFSPVNRHVGDAQGGKNFFIEPMTTNEQFVNLLEVFPRTSALDNPMVIGGGERDGFTNT